MDPLFKKASADFDEGGAKGLLLNHLAIDAHGRIVFDSSDDGGDATAEENTRKESEGSTEEEPAEEEDKMDIELSEPSGTQNKEIDIDSLGARFFPDLSRLDEQDICPSLKNFDLGDPAGSLDIPFLKAPEDWRQEKENKIESAGLGDHTGIMLDNDNAAGFDNVDDPLGGFDVGGETAFGEGGEAWAKDAALEPQMRVQNMGNEELVDGEGQPGEVVGSFDPESNAYAISLHTKPTTTHETILSYFDNALQKSWAGPEHWRIRRIKDITKPTAPTTSKRKEKEPFEIDFFSPLDPSLAELIYTPASSIAAISLPKTQWKSKTRNLLPDDKHFNSKDLLRLFLKPKARMGSRRSGLTPSCSNPVKQEDIPSREIDEAFWARKENPLTSQPLEDEVPQQGNYDANFFQDDSPGIGPPDADEDFADAREAFSPSAEGEPETQPSQGIDTALQGTQEGAFGSQLVTQSRRLRPEYVQYARTATKVDVRRLKEEMWKGIGFSDDLPAPPAPTPSTQSPDPQTDSKSGETLKFTNIMNGLQTVYPKQAMADISTSYCFICLLHLANEKGLVIEKEEGLTELSIRRDLRAEITYE